MQYNGNIVTLNRYAHGAQPMDGLHYTYLGGGNQLAYIVDDYGDVAGVTDYPGGQATTQSYFYDANGNMVQGFNKGITTPITYSYLNKPEQIDFGNGEKIRYIYDAAGTKLAKKIIIGNETGEGSLLYSGNFVYDWNGALLYILHSEGRLVPDGGGYRFEYFMKDHLGNTRATYAPACPGLAQVAEYNHYYPFGMELEGLSYTSGADLDNLYLYNGKELQKEFGLEWFDYGARYYDPQTDRWTTVDPLAENYQDLSPYIYVSNNPLKFIDPNGKSIDNYIVDESGTLKEIEKNDEPHRLFVQNDAGETTELELNDPKNDREQLEAFSIGEKTVEFVSEVDINGIMSQSEMKNENQVSRYYTALTTKENKMDFGVRYLMADPTKDNTGGFIVFGNKSKAFNLLDAGNFLWGQGMKRLGFDLSTAKFGADANELFNDTSSDQQAISDGYNYNVFTKTNSGKYEFKGDKERKR